MAGGPTKTNLPNSHPSNPIHKAATKTDPKPAAQTSTEQTTPTEQREPTPTAGSSSESHDANKIAVTVGTVAVAGLMFLSFR